MRLRLKEFKAALAEELAKEQARDPLTKEKALNLIRWAVVLGAVVWGAVAVAAAIMLVGFGAWGWVVWPLAFYWWTNHVARSLIVYSNARKPKPKVEQNVVFNVRSELTEEEIAAAAERAFKSGGQYTV